MDIWNEIWNGWESVLHHMKFNLIKYMIKVSFYTH